MRAPVLEFQHPPQPQTFVVIQPAIDGVRVTRAQEALARDGMGRLPSSDLQQRGTPFPDIGPRVVVTVVEQFLALRIGQG